MNIRTSLTSPHDIKNCVPQNIENGSNPQLSNEEVKLAKEDLIAKNYLKLDRCYTDPMYRDQKYCVHSFVPSQGSSPDEHGVYGYMKCRGTFVSEDEASQRCEWIIRYQDSYHPLQMSYCGRPFPVTAKPSEFAKEEKEIDISKRATEEVSRDVRAKRDQEKKEMREIEERRKNLLSDVKKTEEDPEERYTTLQVKKADVVFKYVQLLEECSKYRKLIRQFYRKIREEDSANPELRKGYFKRYMDARMEVGLDTDAIENSFIAYMGDSVKLDFDVDGSDTDDDEEEKNDF